MGDDSVGWAAVSSPGLVFLLICREGEWDDQIPTMQEAPEVCRWRHPDRKQRPPISQEEVSLCVYIWVVVVGGRNGVKGKLPTPQPPPFMHIIACWGWAALGMQCCSSSHQRFWIVMRSWGYRSLCTFNSTSLPKRLTSVWLCMWDNLDLRGEYIT